MELTVQTGDILLFCRESWKSSWLRTFTDSNLEHSGIAIRSTLSPSQMIHSKDKYDSIIPPGEPYDPVGTYLYVMDQMVEKKDVNILLGEYISGFRLVIYESKRERYRHIVCRHLKFKKIVAQEFKDRFKKFCELHYQQKFMSGNSNFVKFSLGIRTEEKYGMTCTMLTSAFMREVLQIKTPIILGPHHFDPQKSDNPINRLIDKEYEKHLTEISLIPPYPHQIFFPEVIKIIIILIFIFLLVYFISRR